MQTWKIRRCCLAVLLLTAALFAPAVLSGCSVVHGIQQSTNDEVDTDQDGSEDDAGMLYASKQYAAGEVAYKGLVKTEGESYPLLMQLGLCQEGEKHYKDASTSYKRAIEVAVDLQDTPCEGANIYYHLGYVLVESGDYREGKAMLKRSMGLGIDDSRCNHIHFKSRSIISGNPKMGNA